MNSNLPIPYEAPAPYLRPHKKEKKRAVKQLAALTFVAVILLCIAIAVCFLPEDMKNTFSGFFSAETTDTDSTTGETTTVPDATDGTTAPEETTDIYEWNAELPHGATAILPRDCSANTLGIFAENPTDAVLEAVTPSFPHAKAGEVSVLVINTHSFESYADEGTLYYTDTDFAANGAEHKRVSAAAKALCSALGEYGIGAVFVDCMAETSLGSYANAERMLEIALAQYPEVSLVIDVHRGILMDDTGSLVRPITARHGEILAQVRFLLGADAGFEGSAAVALALFEAVSAECDTLVMPTVVSDSAYLQSFPVPVLTVEIGAVGNSVSEAENSAAVLGEIISRLLLA